APRRPWAGGGAGRASRGRGPPAGAPARFPAVALGPRGPGTAPGVGVLHHRRRGRRGGGPAAGGAGGSRSPGGPPGRRHRSYTGGGGLRARGVGGGHSPGEPRRRSAGRQPDELVVVPAGGGPPAP